MCYNRIAILADLRTELVNGTCNPSPGLAELAAPLLVDHTFKTMLYKIADRRPLPAALLWIRIADQLSGQARIEALTLPDANDRHILAAAIHGEAQCIVTTNLRDFPADILARFGLVAVHPDVFLSRLVNENPEAARAAFLMLCAERKNPSQSPGEVTTILRRQGLTATADGLAALLA